MELAYFDPLKMKYPQGVVSKNTMVKFFVSTNLKCTPNELYLMLREDSEIDYKYILMHKLDIDDIQDLKLKNELKMINTENFEQKVYYFCEINFENQGLYFYNFKLNYNDFEKYLSKTNDNYSILLDNEGEDFVQVVTKLKYESTSSLQGGLIYQIFVDRFCKVGNVSVREPLKFRDDWGGKIQKFTNNSVKINEEVFCGNLAGVVSKLDFLKNLGVTTIYLNPICFANSNHKYDTADFLKVDEMFGGDKMLQTLIDKAKEFDIKIILDGVYNHTGSDSIYFNKCSRFDSVGAYNSTSSKYFPWFSFRKFPNDYECWWGILTLPSVKKNCLDFQNFIAGKNGVIEKFMKMGVSGFRLDVVDELSDEFTKKISDKILSYDKNAVVMGEVWEDASTKISYSSRRKYFTENELNSVMNYPLKESIINYLVSKSTSDLVSTLRMLKNNYPKPVLDNLMNTIGTHDTDRIFSVLLKTANGERSVATSLLKICYSILFTLPGVPSIFYGDEYGMENNDNSPRGCYDWKNYKNEIFEFTSKLAKIRKMKVFKDGVFNILLAESGKFVFERLSDCEHIVVLTNLRKDPLYIKTDGNFVSYFSEKNVSDLILSENEFEILIEKH